MSFLKGTNALPMVEAFAKQFPLSGNIARPTSLSVDMFDRWADALGYLSLQAERDTINTLRNSVRYRINYGACSPPWVKMGNLSFHIGVKDHGISYVVQPALEAFDRMIDKLPAQVASVTQTKYRALQILRESGDFAHLPPALQVRITMGEGLAGRLVRDVQHAVNEVNREFTMIQHQLKKLGLVNTNGGVRQLLEVDTSADNAEEMDDQAGSELMG